MGAAITAVLFDIGKSLLGFYLGHTTFASVYGAAGSLAIILTWVFYSAQILFLGAEFTQVYVRKWGEEIVPDEYAIRIPKTPLAKPSDHSDFSLN
jgi:membrane protein